MSNNEIKVRKDSQNRESDAWKKLLELIEKTAEDEVEEFILYDYINPNNAIVYDSVENVPTLDNYGNLVQIPYQKMYVLIAPVLTFLIHIPWALIVLF